MENEKQKALTLAQQEQNALKDRIDQLSNQMEEHEKDNEKLKRENSARLDKDRAEIASLLRELSRVKGDMDDTTARLMGDKTLAEENLRRERSVKSDLEAQIESLKTALKYANDKVDAVVEELEETRRKLTLAEDMNSASQVEYGETEMRLQESKAQISRLEKSRQVTSLIRLFIYL